jgi:catechol 2,3-dioxygenase-like lactoylglutathione lyase family enzyme
MRVLLLRVVLIVAGVSGAGGLALAQGAAPAMQGPQLQGPPRMEQPPPPTVLSLGEFTLVVSDLDRSVAFYRDVIGLKLLTPPSVARADSVRSTLLGIAGGRRRSAAFLVPNEPFTLLLEEYSGVERSAVRSNHNDPGSSFLNFGVWDGQREFDALQAGKTALVGKGGYPAKVAPGRMSAVWVRDPDGHLMEVMQGGWDTDKKMLRGIDNVYRAHFGMTMQTYQQALAFYHDLLGFDITAGFPPMVSAGQYMSAAPLAGMLGIPAEAHMTGVAGHCAGARCEMFEFKDAPRTPFVPRLQDPGAAYLSVWVSDLAGLLASARSQQLAIVTTGDQPVHVKAALHTLIPGQGTEPPVEVHDSAQIMIRDPSGFPLLLMQRVD